MSRYDIEVTAEHIANGDRMDTFACALALAINDGLGETEDSNADVGLTATGLYPRNMQDDATVLTHSNAVASFVSDFDAGRTPDPITIRVDTADKTIILVEELNWEENNDAAV